MINVGKLCFFLCSDSVFSPQSVLSSDPRYQSVITARLGQGSIEEADITSLSSGSSISGGSKGSFSEDEGKFRVLRAL